MAQRVRKGLANWITESLCPIFILDMRRVVLVFNQGCEELTGWAAADVIGKECASLPDVAPERVESVTSALFPPQNVLNGIPSRIPSVIRHRKGESTPVSIHFFPLNQEEEQKQRILGVITPLVGEGERDSPNSQTARFDLQNLLTELQKKFSSTSIIAGCPEMRRVVVLSQLATKDQVPVHLIGERGVGKQHVARTIHYTASEQGQRFLPLDCAKLSHFEIARTLRRLMSEAPEDGGGTIYLQNLHRLSRDLQMELLQHLQNETWFRWMSSSPGGLEQLDEDVFEADLAVTLSALSIAVPTLRQRKGDLQFLAMQLLVEDNFQRKQPIEGLTDDVLTEFAAYHWPGNVAELKRVILHAARRQQAEDASTPVISLEHLPFEFRAGRDAQSVRPNENVEGIEEYLERIERDRIREVLIAMDGNKSAAADALKIPRAKLYRRITALKLEEFDT